jgi:hypothetical protein
MAGKFFFSSASPTVWLKRAPCCLGQAWAASASSAGPMCSAGVLTRSRTSVMACGQHQATLGAGAGRQQQFGGRPARAL